MRSEPIFDRRIKATHVIWQGLVVLLWLGTVVIGGFILRANPIGHGTHRQIGLPACGSVVMFNRPCPACGLTTSWTSFLHGQIGYSFVTNWFGPLLFLAFTAYALLSLVAIFRGQRFNDTNPFVTKMMSGLVSALLIYGVIRFAFVTY